MPRKPEVYISIDIETNGPCPGLNSMLAVGAVAYYGRKAVGRFYRKLYPLPYEDGAIENADTMIWWAGQPEAWEEVNKDQRDVTMAVNEFGTWLKDIEDNSSCKLIAAAWPAGFDFGFVNWYLHNYYGDNPLGFSCLDIRSYANGLFNTPGYYERISEGDLYKFFNIDLSGLRQHVAVDDAERQGRLLMALIEYAEKMGVNV